jgi:hypothetical protein
MIRCAQHQPLAVSRKLLARSLKSLIANCYPLPPAATKGAA